MTPNRVWFVQGLRRSNAAGPHGSRKVRDDEPCVCATGFTCLAREHDDRDDDQADEHDTGEEEQ